ncbi:MAG: hypothetical protein Ct9H300mP10_02100 [Methanobacteriota archaeon]|nr:MAG: hypothetical protein Ct9H300mP10_02100 [Euryarchaeota archaeon]
MLPRSLPVVAEGAGHLHGTVGFMLFFARGFFPPCWPIFLPEIFRNRALSEDGTEEEKAEWDRSKAEWDA